MEPLKVRTKAQTDNAEEHFLVAGKEMAEKKKKNTCLPEISALINANFSQNEQGVRVNVLKYSQKI